MELGLLASTIELSIDEYELAIIDTRELVHLATHELLVDGVDLAVVELVELLGLAREQLACDGVDLTVVAIRDVAHLGLHGLGDLLLVGGHVMSEWIDWEWIDW